MVAAGKAWLAIKKHIHRRCGLDHEDWFRLVKARIEAIALAHTIASADHRYRKTLAAPACFCSESTQRDGTETLPIY
jgi:hypothetical protein